MERTGIEYLEEYACNAWVDLPITTIRRTSLKIVRLIKREFLEMFVIRLYNSSE